MADKLTPQQEMAVKNRGGKLLVSAAAGSGKTKVLVDRLMRCLTDPGDPADLDEFLIITYTKAAASELRGKIAARLNDRIAAEPENKHLQKQMQRLYLTQISTVHGFCTSILREYAYRIDLSPDFRVADEGECRELRETVLQELLDQAYDGQDQAFRDFVDSQGVGRSDAAVPEIIQKVYDSARCHLDPQGWLESCLKNSTAEGVSDASETVWGKFLMDDLFSWLDAQLAVLRICRDRLEACPGMEKPAANIGQTVCQLEHLRSSTTWDMVCQRKDILFGTLTFPKKNNPDPDLTEQVKAVRNACKAAIEGRTSCFSAPSEQVLAELRQCGSAASGLIGLVRRFDAEFSRVKRSRRILDFSDLEQRALDLLTGKERSCITAAAREIAGRFREIMVDEYQDSNGVQDAIFGALTEQRQNCFLVGDVKQSIYQFRLADPQIFLEKYRAYLPAEDAKPGQGRKVLLSHNFRSGPEIISAVNDIFTACMRPEVGGLQYGEAEALREWIPQTKLPDAAVELYVLESGEDSYAEEAAFAAGRIREMLDAGTLIRDKDTLRRVTAEDIVILLRSPGPMGRVYQKALEARGIRCAMEGGMDLMQTEEVATFWSFLQTIANPRQDIPLLSVLASPVFGFTADDLAAIRGREKDICFYEALRGSRMPKARAFLQTLDVLRRKARMEPLTELLQSCMLLTRMDSVYGAMPGGKARKENLHMFYRMAAEYEASALRSLDQFLEHLESMNGSGILSAGSSSAGCVTVMSIHKSKGLEFPVVFLCGLSRQFNRESLRQQVLCDKELGLGLCVADNQARVRSSSIARRAIAASMKAESVSEEMRVLYVAMTRAKDRLVMTCTLRDPEKTLQEIALRSGLDGGRLLCMEADRPGDWVLFAAMQRHEAGALHALAGSPGGMLCGDHPWHIALIPTLAPEEETAAQPETARVFPEDAVEKIRAGLDLRYGHLPATTAPSKQTATGRRGRSRDEEARENTPAGEREKRAWRKLGAGDQSGSGKAYGNAVHLAMQFIRYENCTDLSGVDAELERMVDSGLLTEEQGKLVDRSAILGFFTTDIGRKLCAGAECLREFKFSVLDDGAKYGVGLENEQILLQGVVDCALLEEDGITVVDFKTDHIGEARLPDAAERYRTQLETYAEALTRIYETRVKAKYLYFFHLGRLVRLP